MTRYAFIGNCQIQALYHLYRRHVAPQEGDVFDYIRSYDQIGDSDRLAISRADLVIEQVQDFKPKADIAGIETAARRIHVPVVSAGFLWPYAGQPHPRNTGAWYLDGGPYGSEASDAFLNRMINRKVDPEQAVARYLDTDVNKTMSLDRLLELSLEKQRTRDGLTGFSIADVIAEHFRDELIFRTPYHPNVRIAKALATQFFEQAGVSADDTQRMQQAMRITPFPKDELPLHPAVIRHFGLRYADADTRYTFLSEGSFTFTEYASRYMGYEWNAALQEGIALVRGNDIARAIETLREGLAMTSRSAAGHAALANALHRSGDHAAAIAEMRKSLAIDPNNASVHSSLAGIFNHLKRSDEAETSLRMAGSLDPSEPHYATLLANWLRGWGRPTEARDLAEGAIKLAPYTIAAHVELAYAHDRTDQPEQAEACFRKALALEPESLGAMTGLAPLLGRLARWEEAAALWRRVLTAQPDNIDYETQLAHALRLSGDLPGVIETLEQALATRPQDISLLSEYAACLAQAERSADAIIVLRTAATIEPGNLRVCERLVNICRQTGDLAGDEAGLRQMMGIDATAPGPVAQLAQLLSWMRRWPEAIVAAERALALGAQAGSLHALLATIHHETGNAEAAGTALAQAAALAPNDGDLHYKLSQAWAKLHKPQDAVVAAQVAATIDPSNPHWQNNLGHMLAAVGALDAAETAVRAAIAASPTSAGFYSSLADLLLRRGDVDAAIEAARSAAAAAPGNAHFESRLNYMLNPARRSEVVAEAAPQPAQQADPEPADRPHAVRDLIAQARSHKSDGELDVARLKLEEAVGLAPENGEARYSLSQVFAALNAGEAALDSARRAVAIDPGNPHWQNHLGYMLVRQAQMAEAEASFRMALRLKPDNGGFHNSLGHMLGRQGRLDEATAAVREAVGLEPRNIHFLEQLSQLLDSAGDTEGAVRALQQAHLAAPDNSHFRGLLARMQAKHGQAQPAQPAHPAVA